MTTSITTFDVSSFTTDTKFRAWGTAINAALTAAGLTNTADTGQINWTTVTKATAGNTMKGYEIWRFNDSLQSTKPIFFRVDYGSANQASGNNQSIWITLGTGSNGSGTITGVGSSATALQGTNGQGTSASTNTNQRIGACYSTSAGAMCLIIDTYNPGGDAINSGVFMIARSCDTSTGSPTGDGVALYQFRAANTIKYTANYNTSSNSIVGTTGISAGFLSTSTYSTGSTVSLLRNYVLIPNPYGNNGCISYLATDISAWTTFSASPFGTSHTYMALSAAVASGATFSQSASYSAALIWE